MMDGRGLGYLRGKPAGWSPWRTTTIYVVGDALGDDGQSSSAGQREVSKLMHELLLFSSDGVVPGAAIRTEIPPVNFPRMGGRPSQKRKIPHEEG